VAGFLDADGCVGLSPLSDKRPRLYTTFSQRADRDEVLHMIHEQFGGVFVNRVVGDGKYTDLTLSASATLMMLNRVAQHLVIKRAYVHRLLELREMTTQPDELRKQIKEARTLRSLPIPNFPSRKWLAGYFDGDGCLSVQQVADLGQATIVAYVACAAYDTEGIDTICKNFGGRIYDMCAGRCRQWKLILNPSKAKQFLGYFAKYSIIKKAQADFVLGCAQMGHFRDGRSIKAALKQLKASEHRLSESGNVVKQLLLLVQDKERKWTKDGKDAVCVSCGSNRFRHVGHGLCNSCYQKRGRGTLQATVGA
jgi:hypothetical protein